MSKRSPILGYNHNIQHRGLTFHVQTEDSGVNSPHIYTHLFCGGVILSSRKLQYDNEASEETVKALMQAQHKAALKDLKRGKLDVKIDQYLGGTPGLLPSGTATDTTASPRQTLGHAATIPALSDGAPVLEIIAETPSRPIPIVELPPLDDVGNAATLSSLDDVPVLEIIAEEPDQSGPATMPRLNAAVAGNIDLDAAAEPSDLDTVELDSTAIVHDRVPAQTGRIATTAYSQVHRRETPGTGVVRHVERIPTDRIPKITTPSGGIPEIRRVSTPPPAEEVSGSIDVPDAISAAPTEPVPAARTGVHPAVEVRFAAPSGHGRAPLAVGSTEQLPRPTDSGSMRTSAPPPRSPSPGSVPGTAPRSAPPGSLPVPPRAGLPTVRGGAPAASPVEFRPPSSSSPTVDFRPPSAQAVPPVAARSSSPSSPPPGGPGMGVAMPRTATPNLPVPPRAPAHRPEGKRGRSVSKPPPQSGVVVSRPAVIIGAPPKIVGGPAGGPGTPAMPPDTRRSTPRRAREERSRSSLFGKDLISEKSLDEVILAYLSEDTQEE